MSPEITVAALSLAGTLVGTWGGLMTSTKLTGYRIQQLETKVEKHNQIVEKVYRLEDNDVLFEEKLKVANKRIADLERHEEKHNDR